MNTKQAPVVKMLARDVGRLESKEDFAGLLAAIDAEERLAVAEAEGALRRRIVRFRVDVRAEVAR